MLDAEDATTPDYEVDEFTGKLKRVELKQNTVVYSSLNRNLLYTKSEIDAKIGSGSGGGGSGDVVGPSASTDNALVRFDGTTGKLIQDYSSNAPTVTDTGQMFVGPPPTAGTQGTILNTSTADLNSNIIINSFQAIGPLNAGLGIQSLQFNATDNGGNAVSQIFGLNGLAVKSGSGSVGSTGLIAIQGSPRLTGTATAVNQYAFNAQVRTPAGTSATTTVGYNVAAASSGGTVTSAYGFRAAAQKVTGVTNGYGVAADGTTDINYFLGQVSVGSIAPNANAALDVSSTTKAFMPPRMTTTQKNAIPSPTAGMVVYDNVLNKLCVYTTAWETITSV